jgi:hypothetical protein
VEVPEPVEEPPPERVPLELPPVTTGGMVAGQGRKKIPPQPGLTLPALAVIGKAATRTIATARVPSTFFMTFSFFKTVFVSIRFSFRFRAAKGDCNGRARFGAERRWRRRLRAASKRKRKLALRETFQSRPIALPAGGVELAARWPPAYPFGLPFYPFG